MTSADKIRANRVNAQTSTGPRTAQGKARAARNARRHGLSVSIFANPSVADDVKTLAQEMAGDNATAEIQEFALRAAEAQMELRRIRQARYDLLNQHLRDPYCEPWETTRAKIKFLMRFATGPALMAPVPDLAVINARPRWPRKLAGILADLTKQLAAMDRYERRALSRRKFAIRDFVALRNQNNGLAAP